MTITIDNTNLKDLLVNIKQIMDTIPTSQYSDISDYDTLRDLAMCGVELRYSVQSLIDVLNVASSAVPHLPTGGQRGSRV